MIVSDELVLNVHGRVTDGALHVRINPAFRDKYLAIELQFRGFKRAALVNPATHKALGTYDSVIEFATQWLYNDFGYVRCHIEVA